MRIEVVDRHDTTIGAGTDAWWVRGAVDLRAKITVRERDAMGMLPSLEVSSPTAWLSTASVLSKLRRLKRERNLGVTSFAPWQQANGDALKGDTLLALAGAMRRAGHRLFRFRVPDEQFQPWRIEDTDGQTIGAIAPCHGIAADTLFLSALAPRGGVR